MTLRDDEILTVRETATALEVHENTVRNWVKEGRIDAVKRPNSSYQGFRRSEVERVLRERKPAGAEARSTHNPELIDADFLDAWGGRGVEELVPWAVARLLGLTPGLIDLNVQSGREGIRKPGWDVEIGDAPGNAWVPSGSSRWEIGTGAGVQAKAQRDYKTRSADPLGADPAVTTFVFLTQRRWPAGQKWAAARREEGIWKDVRVIDADELGTWLETNPLVQIWLSEEAGLRPLEVRSLGEWWKRFSQRTKPRLHPDLLTAGRAGQVEQLRAAVGEKDRSQAIGVIGGSRIEALGFVAAALLRQADGRFLGERALVAHSPEAWERLCLSSPGLILIADTEQEIDVAHALAQGHCPVVPLEEGPGTGLDLVTLTPLARAGAEKALEEMGIDYERAARLAGIARRSFPALLRTDDLAVATLASPLWSRAEAAQLLAPLVLVGAWEDQDADRQLIERLTGTEWRKLDLELRSWLRSKDAPFVSVDSQWRLAAPEEAWALLEPKLTREGIAVFTNVAHEVLTELDPALEITPNERPYASLHGVKRRYSPTLRRGVAQGVALLGVFGTPESRAGGDQLAHRLVRALMEWANDDDSGIRWASLTDQSQLLAEAAPDEFLFGISQGLRGDPPPLRGIFQDGKDSSHLFGGGATHSDILWALETLCWSEEHLSVALDALAGLEEIDPGGTYSNRPSRSLRSILLPWLPQTSASLERRLDALDALIEKRPEIAWGLLVSMLPKTHDSSQNNSTPRFRDWPVTREGVEIPEWLETIVGLVSRVIATAGNDRSRWAEIVHFLGGLPADQREQIFEALRALKDQPANEADEVALWTAIVDEVHRHRAYPDARWSMACETIDTLESVADDLEPVGSSLRYRRLFDHRPELGEVERGDHVAWENALAEARNEAVTRTEEESGLEGVLHLARESVLTGQVGVALGRTSEDRYLNEVLGFLDQDETERNLAAGWIWARAVSTNEEWPKETFARLSGAPAQAQAEFLLAIPDQLRRRELIDGAIADVQGEYWGRASSFTFLDEHVPYAAERFLKFGRPWQAVDCLSSVCSPHSQSDVEADPRLVVTALKQALESQSSDETERSASLAYEIGELLDYLEDNLGPEAHDLVDLEWSYFSLLEHEREARALFRVLEGNPEFFVELVSLVFRGDNEAPRKGLSEEELARARNAASLLDAWRRPPGTSDEGKLDGDVLRKWVRAARSELANRDREAIGDDQIGAMLSGSVPGEDGIWPAEPVRELIEDLASKKLETGLEVGRFNARGITSRGVYDGGQQEWELAARYRADAKELASDWPRTSQLLIRMAESYEEDARREDASANRDANRD